MSYSVEIYMIQLERMKVLIGSRDQALLESIVSARRLGHTAQAELLARMHEILTGENEERLLEKALTDLVNVGSLSAGTAYKHKEAIRLLAQHIGRYLRVPGLESIHYDYLIEVGEVLAQQFDIPRELRFPDLVGRLPPLGLPASESLSGIGFLAAPECLQVANLLGDADLDDFDADPEVLEGVMDYGNMIDAAVAANSDLLIFYG